MKIIIGLGNPGNEYVKTRHNVGFDLVEKLGQTLNCSDFTAEKKFEAEITEGNIHGEKVLLVKPQTFMNRSGEVTQKILSFFKLTPTDIVVIHDDLDIPIGKHKIATDSSSAGHNGVQNIIDQLGTQAFRRVRVGIGEAEGDTVVCRLNAHDFVLGKITPEEAEKIGAIENTILEDIQKLI